jgi:hypothetical protein
MAQKVLAAIRQVWWRVWERERTRVQFDFCQVGEKEENNAYLILGTTEREPYLRIGVSTHRANSDLSTVRMSVLLGFPEAPNNRWVRRG